MRRASICFLALLTFWMFTWMVTDIHDWSLMAANQSHPVFSTQQSHSSSDIQAAIQNPELHCEVCSYDHGGHIGQTLIACYSAAKNFSVQHPSLFSLQTDFWYSREIEPGLRPPIV